MSEAGGLQPDSDAEGLAPGGAELSAETLTELRRATQACSRLLEARLAGQLEALRPVFAPRRLLGRHVRGGLREDAPAADRALREIRERFARSSGAPFPLPKELEDPPLSLEPVLELSPYAYRHAIAAEPQRWVTLTNPVCWTLSYRSGYRPAELEAAIEQGAPLRVDDLRQFLLSALTLKLFLETFPGVPALLEALRYEVRYETRPALGELPLVTLRAPVPSFRPPDTVIERATAFSGIPAFIELISPDALEQLRDPLREQLSAALGP